MPQCMVGCMWGAVCATLKMLAEITAGELILLTRSRQWWCVLIFLPFGCKGKHFLPDGKAPGAILTYVFSLLLPQCLSRRFARKSALLCCRLRPPARHIRAYIGARCAAAPGSTRSFCRNRRNTCRGLSPRTSHINRTSHYCRRFDN